ncbi:MAG: nucleotidyltransferase domain-containing protein [Candidatus Aenigmatarchaeota archaeon]
MVDRDKVGVTIPIPLPKEHIFRNQAMDDILGLLYENPYDEFSIRELRKITGHGGQTVSDSIERFQKLGVIEIRWEGKKKLISIDQRFVQKPDDPYMKIPQEEFRTPVRRFIEKVEALGNNLLGVLVFGSVARGDADRRSDIDIFVLVREDLLQSRRKVQEMRREIEEERFEGDRYEFQVMVESLESAEDYGEKLKEIFLEGITLEETEEFRKLRRGVLRG